MERQARNLDSERQARNLSSERQTRNVKSEWQTRNLSPERQARNLISERKTRNLNAERQARNLATFARGVVLPHLRSLQYATILHRLLHQVIDLVRMQLCSTHTLCVSGGAQHSPAECSSRTSRLRD